MNFKTYVSGCCGATETDTRNSDTAFCGECGEHTTFIPDTEYFEDEETAMKVNSLVASMALCVVATGTVFFFFGYYVAAAEAAQIVLGGGK